MAGTSPAMTMVLFAEFARREIAAVDRLLEERLLAVLPELADVRVGLDHGVPQLLLVVTEHLLLLDLLVIDVLDRIAELVEADRTMRRFQLECSHRLSDFVRNAPVAAGRFLGLVDH